MKALLRRKLPLLSVFVIIVLLYGVLTLKFRKQYHDVQRNYEVTDFYNDMDEIAEHKRKHPDYWNEPDDRFPLIISDENNDKLESVLPTVQMDITTSDYEDSEAVVIPVVVIVYNRPSVSRCLDLLMSYNDLKGVEFPIVVSQDGNHKETTEVIQSYKNKVTHLRHPNEPINVPANHRNFMGYYKISTHYKWAISQTFKLFPNSKALIIVEDDLEIAPDFFSYFHSTYPLLLQEESLYCVSAWNDNGKDGLVDNAGATTLYRSDFFPGLGWMLKKTTWGEVEPKWPRAFWDDWYRLPAQRKNRACIRPEISRTKTFGRIGVSNGQFYDKYLKYIRLNDQNIDWTEMDLSYLEENNYVEKFVNRVYELPLETIASIQSGSNIGETEVRLEFASNGEFKRFAKTFGLMEDLKSGVPRMAYQGIVSFMRNGVRIHLAPRRPWHGYTES